MRTVYDNAADEDAQQRVITDIHKHASIKKFLHRQMLRWDKKILDTIMDNI
jgi:hypothetical protein